MADRVAVFNDGKIMQVGAPEEIYSAPRSRFVADFVGSSNVLPPDAVARFANRHAWASIRPESIRIVETGGEAATVVGSSYLGATTRLSVDMAGQRMTVLLPAGTPVPSSGSTVSIKWNANDLHIMEDEA